MSDKSRVLFPIAITFSDGERPSSVKMNGLATQAKQGLSVVEYALGDVWNQSGDSLLSSIAAAQLMIPNVARYLGSPRHISPRIPHLPEIEEYTHDFTLSQGSNEARLPFPPHSTSTFTWNNGNNATPETNKEDVDASGEWYVDYDTGDVYSYDAFNVGDYIEYSPGYTDDSGVEQTGIYGDLSTSATYNIIPDPDTNTAYNFRGLKIEYKNGLDDSEGYLVYLPPRMPLNTRRVNGSPQNSVDTPSHSGNIAILPSIQDKHFWQGDGVAACISPTTNAEHYRYRLPTLITDNWSQASAVPTGLVYLWDPVGTGTIIEGVTFAAENAAVPKKWMLVAQGSSLTTWLSTTQGQAAYPTANLQSSSHDPAYYPNTGLRLITVGVSLSDAFSSLVKQFLNHDHSSQGSLVSQSVDHNKLSNLFDGTSGPPYLSVSGLTNDAHAQYLHRQGYDASRDHGGAMLGSMVMASTGSSGDYENLTSNSNSIIFGQNSNGFQLYWDATAEMLHMHGPNMAGNDTGVRMSALGTSNILDFLLHRSHVDPYNKITSAERLEMDVTGDINITSTGDATFDPQGGKFIAGCSVALGSAQFFFSSEANNWSAWLLNNLGYRFMTYKYGNLEYNAYNCITGLPGHLIIHNVGDGGALDTVKGASILLAESNTTPTATGASSVRLRNRPAGSLSITREDYVATGGEGEQGRLRCNFIFSGVHNDATYGWSALTDADEWGPVRKHVISPSEMRYNVSHLPGANANWSDQTTVMMTAHGDPISSFTGFLQKPSTNSYRNYAYWPISLPYRKFAIVQVAGQYRHSNAAGPTTWDSNKTISLGYSSSISGASPAGQGTVEATRDFGTIGGPAGTSWSGITKFWTDSAYSTLMEIDRYNDYSYWLHLGYTSDGGATQTWEFTGLIIYYRINEW